VKKIKELVDKRTRDLYYYDALRVTRGSFTYVKRDWDLAPHDLSIMDYVFGETGSSGRTGEKH